MNTERRDIFNKVHSRERRGWVASRLYDDPVLDVGCAEGYITSAIPGREVTAVDQKILRPFYAPGAETLEADIHELPFDDGSFGTVCAFEILEHLEDPLAALKELRRVCSSRLYVTVPAHGHMTGVRGHLQDFDDIRPLVESAGFEVTDYHVSEPYAYLEAIVR